MPDETAPETGQPVEFKAPEGHRLVKEDEWSALDSKAKQFDDLSPKANRWREQATGSQKLIEQIRTAGFESVDQALGFLGTAAKMRKIGANPDHLARAFEPDEEPKPNVLDADSLKTAIRSVLDEVEQQKVSQSREKALQNDFARIDKLAGELAGENATEWDKFSLKNSLEGLYVQSITAGDNPGEALDKVVDRIKAMRETAKNQAAGQEMAQIAQAGKTAKPVKTPTTGGGMGKPTETATSKRKLFSDEDVDARAEELIKGLRGR